MHGRRSRLSIVEYGSARDLVGEISSTVLIDRPKARQILQVAGERAGHALGFGHNPILFESLGVRAVDIAGMIRLAPALELEIAPKFLGSDAANGRWREDFFFLANLSRHGRLLAAERLRASGGAPRDLATLVARSLVDMYWLNRRKPLRSYRRAAEHDFFIEGEVDPFDLAYPTPDGFPQEVVRYDRRNIFNASIAAAARELLPEIADSDVVGGLVRVAQDLGQQGGPHAHRSGRVPSRHAAWQSTIDLSNDVIRGLGLSFKQGFASAPGYVLSTWQAWEHLLTTAARLAYGRNAKAQSEHLLGARSRFPSGTNSRLSVYPDLEINQGNGQSLLLDAKYKSNAEKGLIRIMESDVYEAMAFSEASGCTDVVLAYPSLPSFGARNLGDVHLFERIDVSSKRIYGVEIEVRGISRRSGLKIFSAGLRDGLAAVLAS